MRIGDRVIVDKLRYDMQVYYSYKNWYSPVGYKGEVVAYYPPTENSEEYVTVKLDNWPYNKGLVCFSLDELRYE